MRTWLWVGLALLLGPDGLAGEAQDQTCREIAAGAVGRLDKPLGTADLKGCSAKQLRLVRNTLFARHGYRFKTSALQAHFEAFDWYAPSAKATRKLKRGRGLSAVDQRNLKLVKCFEAERAGGTGRPPLKLAGKKLSIGVASQYDQYRFCARGRVEVTYTISEHQNHRRSGDYTWDGCAVRIHWQREAGRKGIGPPTQCASTCEYAKYEAFDKRIDEREELPMAELLAGEVGEISWSEHSAPCAIGP